MSATAVAAKRRRVRRLWRNPHRIAMVADRMIEAALEGIESTHVAVDRASGPDHTVTTIRGPVMCPEAPPRHWSAFEVISDVRRRAAEARRREHAEVERWLAGLGVTVANAHMHSMSVERHVVAGVNVEVTYRLYRHDRLVDTLLYVHDVPRPR